MLINIRWWYESWELIIVVLGRRIAGRTLKTQCLTQLSSNFMVWIDFCLNWKNAQLKYHVWFGFLFSLNFPKPMNTPGLREASHGDRNTYGSVYPLLPCGQDTFLQVFSICIDSCSS